MEASRLNASMLIYACFLSACMDRGMSRSEGPYRVSIPTLIHISFRLLLGLGFGGLKYMFIGHRKQLLILCEFLSLRSFRVLLLFSIQTLESI